MNWDEHRRTRTQADRGNYPAKHCTDKQWATAEQSCRTRNHIMVTDAAWLWGLCRATWDVPVTRPAGGQDQFEHKTVTATVTAKKPEREIADWMLSHRLEWSQIYGISIAKQICEFIERMQREGKLRGVDQEGARKILTAIGQDLYAKARLAQKAKDATERLKKETAPPQTGRYSAPDITDQTAIETATGKQVIAIMKPWYKLSTGQWIFNDGDSTHMANKAEQILVEREYRARRKLQ